MGKQTKTQSEWLSSLRVYGDVELHKEECINHVSKRLGTAQRKMAASGKKAGITLGGRGFGKLKQMTIVQLTKYYGLSVHAHPNNVDGMQDAVLATFERSSSTDEKPQHNKCPVGADSWCFFQKARATGQEPGPHRVNIHTPLSADVAKHVRDVYTRLSHKDLLGRCKLGLTQGQRSHTSLCSTGQEPGPHRVNVHTPLSADVAKHVRDVYTRLSHKDLLGRCKHGLTQGQRSHTSLCSTGQEPGPHRVNVHTPLSADVAKHVKEVYTRLSHKDLHGRCKRGLNESLHSMVWQKCPKTSFVGIEHVVSTTCGAVAEFNAGVAARMSHQCDVMEVPLGTHLLASAEKADSRRLNQAQRQAAASTKEARWARRIARVAESGSADYAAGEF